MTCSTVACAADQAAGLTDVQQSLAAGFGIHLVKPAEPRVLLDAMDRLVRNT